MAPERLKLSRFWNRLAIDADLRRVSEAGQDSKHLMIVVGAPALFEFQNLLAKQTYPDFLNALASRVISEVPGQPVDSELSEVPKLSVV